MKAAFSIDINNVGTSLKSEWMVFTANKAVRRTIHSRFFPFYLSAVDKVDVVDGFLHSLKTGSKHPPGKECEIENVIFATIFILLMLLCFNAIIKKNAI